MSNAKKHRQAEANFRSEVVKFSCRIYREAMVATHMIGDKRIAELREALDDLSKVGTETLRNLALSVADSLPGGAVK